MRLGPLALAIAVGGLAPAAAAAPPPARLFELPGVEALPQVPPLAPPQPPLAEIARLRGTVESRERVTAGIDGDGTPTKVTVVQRLLVRALGDYSFFIPAPAVSVVAAEGSESQPGLRPNQIVWQGFSPRRKLLAARADLRPADSVGALPIRIRVLGMPVRPGRFELVLSLENNTGARVQTIAADAAETEVATALRSLRAAARIGAAVEGRAVPIRGRSVPTTVEVSAPFSLRGAVRFPPGSVRGLTSTRFSGVVGGRSSSTLRVTVSGVALRPAAARIRVLAEPLPAAATQGSPAGGLRAANLAYLRYARVRQYLTFLANPDPTGPSRTTYVFETATPEPSAVGPQAQPDDDPSIPAPLVVAGLTLLGLGLVVLWAHL